MNDLIVDVKLWGESVGSIYWEKESNAALFDYERKFIRSGLDISPIIMPISQYRNTPYRFLENRTDCFTIGAEAKKKYISTSPPVFLQGI